MVGFTGRKSRTIQVRVSSRKRIRQEERSLSERMRQMGQLSRGKKKSRVELTMKESIVKKNSEGLTL